MRAKVLGILLIIPFLCWAQIERTELEQRIQDLLQMADNSSLTAQLFLGFQYMDKEGPETCEFLIKRGYLSYRKSITKSLSGRITPDITVDREGDGLGDVEMRLKYCYLEYKAPSLGIFSDPSLLFGEVFTPWIEFEEKINLYRMQSPHFLDRIKIFSSADFGVTVTSLLGGKVDADYQKNVNAGYPGKYGSLAVGLYNGGGYHALEMNRNKTLQWRFTLRPLPEALTGLQFSYMGAYGRGNLESSPRWQTHAGFVSYESRTAVLTAQYFRGIGDHLGELTDAAAMPLRNRGYSAFVDWRIVHGRFSLIGRHDVFQVDKPTGTVTSDRWIGGLAWHIIGRNKILFNFDHVSYSPSAKPSSTVFEMTVELVY